MSLFDLICRLISIPIFVVALYRTVWWVRFRRGARTIEGGVIIYKIQERNVE